LDFVGHDFSVKKPAVNVLSVDAACVLYTSGTSGKPKGVIHTHQSIIHNVFRHSQAFSIVSNDRQSLIYKSHVYGGVRDTFNALLHGSSLHIYTIVDSELSAIIPWIVTQKISIYCSVVTVFRHIIKYLDHPLECDSLRIIKLGGEALSYQDILNFEEYFPKHCLLSSGLSSTEAGMITQFFVSSNQCATDYRVPLGQLSTGIECQLNRNSMRNVRGVEGIDKDDCEWGEIVITSPYISPGYYSEKADSVVPLPDKPMFSREGKNIVFYSGDLATIDSDGKMFHAGRKDSQVKISGNRIDLKEIESVLLSLPQVENALVLAENVKGLSALVVSAFVQSKIADTVSIKTFLLDTLPHYMLPSYIHIVSDFPILDNGKLDRKSLLALADTSPTKELLNIEDDLLKIWAELMNVNAMTISDNFLEMGADSITYIQFLSALENELSISLCFSELYVLVSTRSDTPS
jgi:acyl-coenzyme A synthetase/AMP-(fatty) acid ligase/acyl carrier protein